MYFLLGITVLLAAFFIVNLSVAMLASIAWQFMRSWADSANAKLRRWMLLVLRSAPIITALVVTFGFVAPAYLRHEPANSGEQIGLSLALLASASILGIVVASLRFARSWMATRELTLNWLSNAYEVRVHGVDRPINCIPHKFPVIAILGVFRPNLFVSEKAISSLTQSELSAALAHEICHLHSRDNFVGACLRFFQDFSIVPIGRGLERAWANCSEVCADSYAANGLVDRSLDLASAIVKLARQVPVGVDPTLPVGAYFIHGHQGEVGSRVRQLANGVNDQMSVSVIHHRLAATLGSLCICGVAAAFALHLADESFSFFTHQAIEKLVRVTR